MPRVEFTSNLRRHLDCPGQDVAAATVREALEHIFVSQPALRGYVLDDHDRLRKHVTIFIDGRMISDRVHLSDAVQPTSEVYVMQALSGG